MIINTIGTGLVQGTDAFKLAGSGEASDAAQATASGDTVTISDEARNLSQGLAKTDESDDSSGDSTDSTVQNIQKRIKEIQQQIQEIQARDDLSDDDKQAKIQALEGELMTLMNELTLAQAKSGTTVRGGTPAQGFASSLT